MDVKVEIDPEQINQMVVDAILQSAIGEEIQQAVDAEVKRYSKSWDNPIKVVIRRMVDREIEKVVSSQFGPLVREKVIEFMTDDIVDDLITKAWRALRDSYN
jgi:hypothetical protein